MLEYSDIKKLFLVLQARYGHRWTTTYQDAEIMRVAVSEWHRVLKGFRPEDIRRGIESIPDDWPPTLPQFARACLPSLEELGIDPRKEIAKRLPAYFYEADNAKEAARRERVKNEISADVIASLQADALLAVQASGVAACIEGVSKSARLTGKVASSAK